MAITYNAGVITITDSLATGTTSSGTTTTLTTSGLTANRYKLCVLEITGGTGAGQTRIIKTNTTTVFTVYRAFDTAPDNTSTWSVWYDMHAMVALQPSYCAYINQSTVPRITVNATVYVGANGRFGGAHQHMHLMGTMPYFGSSAATAKVQFGELSADGSGKWGGSVSITNLSGGGGSSGFVASTAKFYGCRIVNVTPYIFGADETNLQQWNVGTGQDFRDCTFDTLAVWTSANSIMQDNIWSECMTRFSGAPTTFSGNKFMGGGHIDMVVSQGAPQFAEVNSMKFRGDLDPTYWAFALFGTTANNAYYLWDYDWGSTTLLQGVKFYDNPPCNIYAGFRVGFNVKSAAGANLASVNVRLSDKDGNGAFVEPAGTAPYAPVRTLVYATDANGNIAAKKVLHYKLVASGANHLGSQTDYVPMTLKARKYGYNYLELGGQSWASPVTQGLVLTPNAFVSANEATAGSYTGISVNTGTSTITVSGTRTIQELYDYLHYWGVQSANMGYAELLSTADGTTFTILSGWNIVVTGSLTGLSDIISGTLTVSSGGFFEDSAGAKWDVTGTTYYGSHFYTNVKALTGGANIAGAIVAYFNGAGADVTYNTSKVVGGIVTDASGNAEGYVVWKIGSTVDSSITQYIGEYNYQWSSIPKTVTGSPIGASGAYETVRLLTDSQVTLSKANALAVSGITVTAATTTIDMSDEYLTAAYDNLKARQARADVIEGAIKGYANYVSYGLLISKDGTTYTLKTGWEFANWSIVETGTFRGGRLRFAAPGTYSLKFYDNTFDFETAGTYDLRNATSTGTSTLINTSAGNVTLQLHPDHAYTNTGPNITIDASVAIVILAQGMVVGSRYQLYDVTNATELANGVTINGSNSVNYTYSGATTIRLRVMYQSGTSAKSWYEVTGQTAAGGLTFNVNQSDNLVYNANNIDGSTVTECSVSGATIRIYVDDPNNTTTAQRIYNWYQYYLSTEAGIREQDGDYIYSTDQTHYTFNDDMRIINQDTVNPLEITGANIVPESGAATAVFDVTNGASIVLNFNRVEAFTYSTGSGLSTEEHNALMALPLAAENADAVWDEALSGHSTAGTAGKKLSDQNAAPTAVQVREEMDSNSTMLKKINNNVGGLY